MIGYLIESLFLALAAIAAIIVGFYVLLNNDKRNLGLLPIGLGLTILVWLGIQFKDIGKAAGDDMSGWEEMPHYDEEMKIIEEIENKMKNTYWRTHSGSKPQFIIHFNSNERFKAVIGDSIGQTGRWKVMNYEQLAYWLILDGDSTDLILEEIKDSTARIQQGAHIVKTDSTAFLKKSSTIQKWLEVGPPNEWYWDNY